MVREKGRKVYAYHMGAGLKIHGEIPFLCCEQNAIYAQSAQTPRCAYAKSICVHVVPVLHVVPVRLHFVHPLMLLVFLLFLFRL